VGPLSKLLVLKINKTKVDMEKMLTEEDEGGGIGSLPHLQVLEIGDSGITDISQFAHFQLSALRILHLPGNDITKLEGLSHLEQLRELVIDHNKVKQFDEQSFQGLRCLRELRAEDNCLRVSRT
jgi:Leucine-rich repeat (LRR) protein